MRNILSILVVLTFILISATAFAGEGPMQLPEGSNPEASMHNKEGIKHWEIIPDPPAAQAIVKIAGKEEVDMIIMGTHGRTDLQGLLLGSVTHKVLHLANCPVLIVR